MQHPFLGGRMFLLVPFGLSVHVLVSPCSSALAGTCVCRTLQLKGAV